MIEAKRNISVFLSVLLLVFAAEIAVMLALPVLFPSMHWLLETLLDAFLLTVLISYPLYLLVIKPLRTVALEERRKAEIAALEKHDALHSIFHASPLAVIAVDRDRKVITWNPAAERLFGWKAVEVLGQDVPTIPEDDREKYLELQRMTLLGKTVENLELRRQTKTGTAVSVSVSTAPLRDTEGNVYGAMAIMADITEHKLADEKIQRLNRALAMLSSVNKTIVRLRNKQELLAEVCRIAVKQGDFRMVWIGELDTETLVVRKTACNGVDDGYLDGKHISVGPGPEGEGPTGRAIRYGLPVVSNDIEHDPVMSPWREAALARGFRSSAAFPLRIDKSVIGAMSFYSSEPGCFDEREMNLLIEMAEDVSYALEFIEKEALRKEAEQLVHLAKQDWEETFNTITDMVTIHDADFNIIRANKAAEKLLGLPLISMTRAKCFQYYHGGECPPPGCPSCDCLKTGKPATFEMFEPHLNMYIELTAIPRFDRDNNIVGLIHVARDISEQKKFEGTLRDQKLFAESLVQNSAVATFVLNAEHKVLLWNKACEELTGVPAAGVIGTENHWKPFYEHWRPTIADIIVDGSPEKMPDLYAKFAQSALVPNGLQAEGWYKNLNGRDRYILFDAAPIYDSEGRLIVAIETLHDITPLKRIEEKLHETEHRFKAMIEAEPECVKLLSLDGIILEMNPAGLKLLEADAPGQVVGKAIALFVSPEHRAAFQMYCGDVIREGALTLEFELIGLRGTRHSVQSVSVPLRDSSGAVTAILAVTRDITEQKKLEAQLRHVQKMEAVGTLAGGIAHDFNNILTAIIGYASILKMKMAQDDPLGPLLDQILASTDRAANLTRGLLAFGRKIVISPKPVSANEIVSRVENLLRRLIGEDIDLAVSLTGEDVTMIADTGQIEQVLMNLATNARDAMPGGGRLTILTERGELTNEYISAHGYGKEGKYVVITVLDTGTGMGLQTANRIFEPFFTTKEVGKGTGLGLSMAYGIIKQHNGFINCVSEPGRGTTFRIYLPYTPADVAARPATKTNLSYEGGTETVLLAEDDVDVRNMTASVLRNIGYGVIEAADGQEAVEKFLEHRDAVQLLLFDVMMPKKNGQEAYEEIRRLKPGIRALFTSGYTPEVVLKKGILLEGANFVMKPISPEVLLKKVREVLDK